MFKLFKDLTRPPATLTPPPSSSSSAGTPPGQVTPPYAARQRARSLVPGDPHHTAPPESQQYASVNGRRASIRPVPAARRAPEVEVEEKDERGRRVVQLLREMEKTQEEVEGHEMMHIVETLSQLLSVPNTFQSRRAFRRHRGFEILLTTLGDRLAWRERPEGVGPEEAQVREVQRIEGVRLGLELLGREVGDADGMAAFEKQHGGYLSLLPSLRTLAPSSSSSSSLAPTSGPSSPLATTAAPLPHPKILAHLLAHIFNDNYSILSLFPAASTSSPTTSELSQRLSGLVLRHAAALPLLWAYLWGLPARPRTSKGKSRESALQPETGELEQVRDRQVLLDLTFKILFVAAQTSAANLFLSRKHLPELDDFLMTRLYGFEPPRKYEVTFPGREGWCDDDDDDDDDDEAEEEHEEDGAEGQEEKRWRAPDEGLREVYLALLKTRLEAGVSQRLTWRLFSLAKITERISRRPTPARSPSPTSSSNRLFMTDRDEVPMSESPRPDLDTPTRLRPLPLRIDVSSAGGGEEDIEYLRAEVLELIRHGMKTRWPDVFVFRGGVGERAGGLELRDTGRGWMKAEKGFNFSCWIHITSLNTPLTLVHISQSCQPASKPLFRLRVIESSQLAITTTDYRSDLAAEELICHAPDALIPHHQWVHFAIGMRKSKGSDVGEARIFVNGKRVGAMRVGFPVAVPVGHHGQQAAPQLGKKGDVPGEAIRVCVGRDWRDEEGREKVYEGGADANGAAGEGEEAGPGNEWMLGRVLLLEEAVPEDLVLLMHHLGPRYTGNFQEALGKFLTYEGATSINIYLHSIAQSLGDKRLFSAPTASPIIKAIRAGPTLPEESVLLSLSARDIVPSLSICTNGAVPHPLRARQLRHGVVRIRGDVWGHSATALDEGVESVGGGVVVLKMIDLARTSEELATGLGVMRELVKESWRASEEMERLRGFELLAAILRPKMSGMVDVHCAKIILNMLGINMDKPNNAVVHNSSAYRSLGLEFELWSHASLPVTTLYLQHFEHLLQTSRHSRFNVLRTFQKAHMVKKMLFALRSGLFEVEVVPLVVDTLRMALEARWSGEDAIKPVFSYLVTALCQANFSIYASSLVEAPPAQHAASLILAMIAALCAEPARLVKLNKTLALHRLLVIFISSNSAYYVMLPCLEILERCLTTPGLESFQRSFENEGGFALLGRTLAPMWRADIQASVFRMAMGTGAEERSTLVCPGMMPSLFAAIDHLLQVACESDDPTTPSRPGQGRTRSGTVTSIRSIALAPLDMSNLNGSSSNTEPDTRLQDLLNEMAAVYRASSPFRRGISTKRIEAILPTMTDFAVMSAAASSGREGTRAQREAVAVFLQALVEMSKSTATLTNQMRLVIEQLRLPLSAPSPKISSSTMMSPLTPQRRPSTSSLNFGSSFSSRFGTSPSNSPPTTPTLGRRRPSTEAGLMGSISGSGRPRSIVERRVPLKRVLTGESVLEGGKDKNAAWKLIIIQTDAQAFQKLTLERKEHWLKVAQEDWPKMAAGLRAENGLWPDEADEVRWRLDGSEGPLRMRARLERITNLSDANTARPTGKLRDAIPAVDELSSAVSRMNVAPWEDPFALALGEAAPIPEDEAVSHAEPALESNESGPSSPGFESRLDAESFVEVEENKDDKMRRIARTLQAGDVVEEAHNIVRIVGVDACPGLLILGRKNLYLVDGLVQTQSGEVIDAKDAPRDVLTIPGTLAETSDVEQQSNRWGYNEIVENNKRAFLFRDVALELYFSDKRNFLIVFRDRRERQGVVQKLSSKNESKDAISRSVIGNIVLDAVAQATNKAEQQLEAMTRKWQHREISNFAYLMFVNQLANRTPNDVTQYPIFPWVLADYNSPILDLEKASSYRDLNYPMGALTPARREAAVERYTATEGVGEKPFHYGTHYSSSMIVCGFMIRLSPFTEIFLALQGGQFDLADRLFSSIPRAWDSASADNRGDVRELVPEFFYTPAFLVNLNRHDFGRKQISGDSVDNVILPAWALGDPLLFVHKHREALESDHVSRHLPSWIDLTFGFKQRDPAAFNCFHPLSYRGAVDLESMTDDAEKAASTAIIHNFGQTPPQVFKVAHPHRFLSGRSSLPMNMRFGVAEGWQMLIRSILPITETTTPIDDVVEGSYAESKPVVQQRHRLSVPGTHLSVQYGFSDGSLRVYYQELTTSAARLVCLVEAIYVTRAIFVSPTLLVTLSEMGVLTAWRMTMRPPWMRRGDVTLQREGTLRGHTRPVTCMAASLAWSFLVTGSDDGNAMIWDMNRLRYTRTLQTPHGEAIKFCAVEEANGCIVLVTAHHVYLFSLNGHPIAAAASSDFALPMFNFSLNPDSTDADDNDVAEAEFTGGASFLQREFLRFGVLFVVGLGSEVVLYRCVPGQRSFLEEDEADVQPWKLVRQGTLHRSDDHPGGNCTMVKFMGETLYAGFEPAPGGSKHLLYQWSLPDGDQRHVAESVEHTCMAEKCGRHFGLLEPRRHCGGCGGAFCGTHAVPVETFTKRYCESCRAQLGYASSLGILQYRRDSALLQTGSRPGSRRPSVSGGSRPGSRRPSFSGGRAGSQSPNPMGRGARSREGTPG